MEWLSITSDDPAATLRWVRRVELAFVPLALLFAALLLLKDSPVWWLCCASAALGLLCALTMGPAIKRAEQHTFDAAAWAREAERLTVAIFFSVAAVAVVVVYAFAGLALALVLAALFALSSAAAFAVRRRAGSLRR